MQASRQLFTPEESTTDSFDVNVRRLVRVSKAV
jgi:hypothetical protein